MIKWIHQPNKQSPSVHVVHRSRVLNIVQAKYEHTGIYYCHHQRIRKNAYLDYVDVLIYGMYDQSLFIFLRVIFLLSISEYDSN